MSANDNKAASAKTFPAFDFSSDDPIVRDCLYKVIEDRLQVLLKLHNNNLAIALAIAKNEALKSLMEHYDAVFTYEVIEMSRGLSNEHERERVLVQLSDLLND